MTKAEPSTDDQWQAATKILLALLRIQTEAPGAISPDDLPKVLHDAADERSQGRPRRSAAAGPMGSAGDAAEGGMGLMLTNPLESESQGRLARQ